MRLRIWGFLLLLVLSHSAAAISIPYYEPFDRYDRYGQPIDYDEDQSAFADHRFVGDFSDDRRFSTANTRLNRYDYEDTVFDKRNRFGFIDGIERDLLYAYADSNPYDGVNREHFDDFDDYQCISLDDYNGYANSNPSDNVEPAIYANGRLNDKVVDRKFVKRLTLADYNRIAAAEASDRWDPISKANADEFDRDDFGCFSLSDYNQVAALNPSDRLDVVDFTDFDDLSTLTKLCQRRYGCFSPEDFTKFNLFETGVRRRLDPSFDPFFPRLIPGDPRINQGLNLANHQVLENPYTGLRYVVPHQFGGYNLPLPPPSGNNRFAVSGFRR